MRSNYEYIDIEVENFYDILRFLKLWVMQLNVDPSNRKDEISSIEWIKQLYIIQMGGINLQRSNRRIWNHKKTPIFVTPICIMLVELDAHMKLMSRFNMDVKTNLD